jgi:5-methylcytosine-specific restriction endonuclease McrA
MPAFIVNRHTGHRRRVWQVRREQQLIKEPLCWLCAQRGLVVEATVADHIVPHKGDVAAFISGELQSLCKPCHDKLAQERDHKGFHSAVDTDGYPLDPAHPWHTGRR